MMDPAKRTQRQRDRLQDYFLKQGSLVDPEKFKELKLAELSKRLDELAKQYPPEVRRRSSWIGRSSGTVISTCAGISGTPELKCSAPRWPHCTPCPLILSLHV